MISMSIGLSQSREGTEVARKRASVGGHGGDKESVGYGKRAAALSSLLMEKGLVTREAVQEALQGPEQEMNPVAARAVVKAWKDPEFKGLLLADATRAFARLGVDWGPDKIIAFENTDEVRHLIVCTLCSCYHRGLLRVPPRWFKSLEYRSRTVSDPRGVLMEFGVEVSPDTEIRVHDFTADIFYFVLPRPPPGFQRLEEEELVELVTAECIIGAGDPRLPT